MGAVRAIPPLLEVQGLLFSKVSSSAPVTSVVEGEAEEKEAQQAAAPKETNAIHNVADARFDSATCSTPTKQTPPFSSSTPPVSILPVSPLKLFSTSRRNSARIPISEEYVEALESEINRLEEVCQTATDTIEAL